jgi:hypothetical protein
MMEAIAMALLTLSWLIFYRILTVNKDGPARRAASIEHSC